MALPAASGGRYSGGMAKDDAARRERLKAALRENLRRRKAQARDRAKGADGSGSPADGPEEPRSDED